MSDPILNKASWLIKTGNKKQALSLLIPYVKQHPDDEIAWYGLALAVENHDEKIDCLQRSLSINPNLPEAKELLTTIQSEQQPVPAAAQLIDIPNNPEEQVNSQPIAPNEEPFPGFPLEIPSKKDKEEKIPDSTSDPLEQPFSSSDNGFVSVLRNSLSNPEFMATDIGSGQEENPGENGISGPDDDINKSATAYHSNQNKLEQTIFYIVLGLLLLCIPIALLLVFQIIG